MGLFELKDMQAAKGWKRFIYLSENQPNYCAAHPVKVALAFGSMYISMNPDAICLKEGSNWLDISLVVSISCESHVLGDILEITCKGGRVYHIIAQD